MNSTINRAAAIIRPESIIPGTAALLTLVLLACGDSEKDAREAVAAPPPVATPVEVREPATVEITTPAPRPVTYAEAEEVYLGRRYGEAVEMFESYVRERPDNPWGHYMLGLSSWKAGEHARAESAFVAAIERDPRHVKSHLNLTRVLLDLERPLDALESVEKALELDPESVDGHRLMGRVLTSLGRTGEAVETYRLALSIDSTDTWSMNNMALILIQQGRFEEALGPLARATELQPRVGIFQNNLGIALERVGRFGDAAVAYGAAIESDGEYPRAEVSLERVTKLKEKPDVLTVSLEVLAMSFADEVRGWAESRKPETVTESSGTVEPDC